MSLSVKINSEEIDLVVGSRIKLGIPNPYLVYDKIEGVRASFPSLPFTPRNQRVFGYWQEPASGGEYRDYLCEQYFGGELVQEGHYFLSEASSVSGFQGVFVTKLGQFFGDIQNTKISELDLGTINLPGVLTPVVQAGGQDALCFPTIINANYYGSNAYTGGRMNDYATGAYTANGPRVPMVFVKYVLGLIAAATGTSIDGSYWTNADWSKLIFFNTRALDGATTVKVASHLPELTVAEVILELRKLPNLALTFDTIRKRLTIDFWDDKLAQPTLKDWTAKAVVGEAKTPELNTRLQLSYELDTDDAMMKNRPTAVADYLTAETLGVANGIAKLPTKISTLLVDSGTGLAIVQQEGITTQYGQQSKKFAPRVLFWNGVVSGLPRALPTLNSVSLYWTGANGLAAKYWAQTEALRKKQFYLKKNLILNEADLAQLDLSQKIHIDGMDYIIAFLEVDLPIDKPVGVLLLGGV